jgi:hypothetical protein
MEGHHVPDYGQQTQYVPYAYNAAPPMYTPPGGGTFVGAYPGSGPYYPAAQPTFMAPMMMAPTTQYRQELVHHGHHEKQSNKPRVPPSWDMHTSSTGEIYYTDPDLSNKTFRPPPEGWSIRKKDNRAYFVHHATKSTHWKLPPPGWELSKTVDGKILFTDPVSRTTYDKLPDDDAVPHTHTPQPQAQPQAPPTKKIIISNGARVVITTKNPQPVQAAQPQHHGTVAKRNAVVIKKPSNSPPAQPKTKPGPLALPPIDASSAGADDVEAHKPKSASPAQPVKRVIVVRR